MKPEATPNPAPVPALQARVYSPPDEIMAEVWAVKRQINAEAGYDMARLLNMVQAFAKDRALGQG
jgi:hypothetical protein